MNSSNNQVVFVYGALRSGTTLLRLMLNGNQMLSCYGEMDFLFDYLDIYENKISINKNSLQQDRIFKKSGVMFPNHLDGIDAINDMIYQTLALQNKNSNSIPLVMVHRNLDKISKIFPKNPILHMIRDPRDVARSSVQMGWEGNTFFGVDHWITTESDWRKHNTNFEKTYSFKYESLVSKPDEILNEICDFLNIEFTNEMLDYHKTSTYEPVDAKLAFQWKSKMNPEEVKLVSYKTRSLIESYQYEIDKNTPKKLTSYNILLLNIDNKYKFWKSSVKKFGFLNILMRATGKRLKIKKLISIAQSRIDIITEKNLK